MLSARNIDGQMEAAFQRSGGLDEIVVNGPPVREMELTHVVVVFRDNDTLSLYKDGALQGSVDIQGGLDDIDPVNNWLGRSQFGVDEEFNGLIEEFRIYDGALTSEQISVSYTAGPDYVFPAP